VRLLEGGKRDLGEGREKRGISRGKRRGGERENAAGRERERAAGKGRGRGKEEENNERKGRGFRESVRAKEREGSISHLADTEGRGGRESVEELPGPWVLLWGLQLLSHVSSLSQPLSLSLSLSICGPSVLLACVGVYFCAMPLMRGDHLYFLQQAEA
jgi:hypothetical protein